MSEPAPGAAAIGAEKSRGPGRRAVGCVGLLLLAAVCLAVGLWGYQRLEARKRLAAARAEADRLDPGWRYEDLQARRAVVPDEENSALVVLAVLKGLPSNWDHRLRSSTDPNRPEESPTHERVLSELESNTLPASEQVAALRKDLAGVSDALGKARRLADMPQGRLPAVPFEEIETVLMPQAQDCRQIVYLLTLDAHLRAHNGDADGSLTAAQAALNVGRSIGDEPLMIPQLIRMSANHHAAMIVERALGKGEPSEAAMAATQSALERDFVEPLLLHAVRGERAVTDRQGTSRFMPPEDIGPFHRVLMSGWADASLAGIIRYLNEAVELAKLPIEKQNQAFGEMWRRVDKAPKDREKLLALLLMPAIFKVAQTDLRVRAELGCAVLAVAAEHYRLAHGRWPESVEQLAPFVKNKPVDPFGKGPLRLKRLEDGLVIYSIGPDGQDDGGKLDRSAVKPGTDIGFRLWDVNKRRQPAAMKPAPDHEVR